MGMIVKLIDGREVELHRRYGQTRAQVEKHLHDNALTGSAAVLDSSWVELEGRKGSVRFSAIVQFVRFE